MVVGYLVFGVGFFLGGGGEGAKGERVLRVFTETSSLLLNELYEMKFEVYEKQQLRIKILQPSHPKPKTTHREIFKQKKFEYSCPLGKSPCLQ